MPRPRRGARHGRGPRAVPARPGGGLRAAGPEGRPVDRRHRLPRPGLVRAVPAPLPGPAAGGRRLFPGGIRSRLHRGQRRLRARRRARDRLPRIRPRPPQPHPERAAPVARRGAGRGLLALGAVGAEALVGPAGARPPAAAAAREAAAAARACCAWTTPSPLYNEGRRARDVLLAVLGPRPLGGLRPRTTGARGPAGVPRRDRQRGRGRGRVRLRLRRRRRGRRRACSPPTSRRRCRSAASRSPGLDADVVVEVRGPAPRRSGVSDSATSSCTEGASPRPGATSSARSRATPASGPRTRPSRHAAVRQGRWEEARREVALALAADPADAVALFRYAEMIVRETSARGEVLSPEREAEAVAALERAVLLQPQLADACDLLARLRPEPYDQRIAQVSAALARYPGRADLGLTLAGLHARKNDFAAARGVLLRTRADRARRRPSVPEPAPARPARPATPPAPRR